MREPDQPVTAYLHEGRKFPPLHAWIEFMDPEGYLDQDYFAGIFLHKKLPLEKTRKNNTLGTPKKVLDSKENHQDCNNSAT